LTIRTPTFPLLLVVLLMFGVAPDAGAEEESEEDGELVTLQEDPPDEPEVRTLYPVRLRFDSRFIADSDFGGADATFYRPRAQMRATLPVSEQIAFRLVGDLRATFSDWDGTTDLFDLGPTSGDPFDTLYSGGLRLQGRYLLGRPSLLAASEEWSLLGEGVFKTRFEDGADAGDGFTGGGGIAVGYQLPDRLNVMGGVSVSSRLDGGVRIRPIAFLVWDVTERLRIRANSNGGRVDFRLTDDLRLFARARIQSTRWRLDRRAAPVGEGTLRQRIVPVGLGLVWKIGERLHMSVFGGVVAYHQLKAFDNNRNSIESITGDPAPVFEIRFDVRPFAIQR
jgi:hypothetical protein